MTNLEPTYLRYVYDSLNKGSLNAENEAALPHGFIGLYEQEFAQKTPANKRKKVLNQLALWALFKGPVSANLSAAVLELEEQQMRDLVDTYSSWFNSPESGKYLLYHERLRGYLLQKLKSAEIQVLNEKLISFLEDALKQGKGEEDEYYALEHLHIHMALESQLGNHYQRLHSYVNQESLWTRQIQLSKGYEWSYNAVKQGIKEGARRSHEMNIIRSTVNSVKLMTQEQNSAEDILNLLNEGDYTTALKRAATWEGKRQFKLYLLFIHELTIGTSKDADFKKDACKSTLKAIDKTPEDHSVLDWCEFYPELAIYKYHEELLKMKLDGMIIWRRGRFKLAELIDYLSPFVLDKNVVQILTIRSPKKNSNIKDKLELAKIELIINKSNNQKKYLSQFLVMASEIKDIDRKRELYLELLDLFIEGGYKKEVEVILQEYSDLLINEERDVKFEFLVFKYRMKIGEYQLAESARLQTMKLAQGYMLHYTFKVYLDIAKVTFKYSKIHLSEDLILEIISSAKNIRKKPRLVGAFISLYEFFQQMGEIKRAKQFILEAWAETSNMIDGPIKSRMYVDISRVLFQFGEIKKSKSALQESILIASKIEDDLFISGVYKEISKVLMEQGDRIGSKNTMVNSIKYSPNMYFKDDYFNNYFNVSKLLKNQKKYLSQFLIMASEIKDMDRKRELYLELLDLFIEGGNKKEVEAILQEYSDLLINEERDVKFEFLVFKYRMKIGEYQLAESARLQTMKLAQGYMLHYTFKVYLDIAKVTFKYSKIHLSEDLILEIISSAKNIRKKPRLVGAFISLYEFFQQMGEIKRAKQFILEAWAETSNMIDGPIKSRMYVDISRVLFQFGEIKKSKSALQESKLIASKIEDDLLVSGVYKEISKVLMEQGEREESLKIASNIASGSIRFAAFSDFGFSNNYKKAKQLLNLIPIDINEHAVIVGMSERIRDSKDNSFFVHPFLYQYADKTLYLPNILFYKAKMACFIEKERNQEKLNMLSEVLDIKVWRRIIANT